jgi:hypothetical protein
MIILQFDRKKPQKNFHLPSGLTEFSVVETFKTVFLNWYNLI